MSLWRPMTLADIPTVSAIAREVHPGYPERDVVFADRIALAPEGSWLATRGGVPLGYLLSHPWREGAPPPLDTVLGALPDDPDTFYLHDLALLPEAQGTGLAREIVTATIARAAPAFPSLSLVAVNASVPFWARFGFGVAHRPALEAKLRSYDADARYMVRPS